MSTRVMEMGSTLTAVRLEVNIAPKDSSPSSTSSFSSARRTEVVVVSPPPGGRVTSTGELEKSLSSVCESGDHGRETVSAGTQSYVHCITRKS